MLGKRPAADFDPMIQPRAAFAITLPSAIDVFDFHGFFSGSSPSLTSPGSSLVPSLRSLHKDSQELPACQCDLHNSCQFCRVTNRAVGGQSPPRHCLNLGQSDLTLQGIGVRKRDTERREWGRALDAGSHKNETRSRRRVLPGSRSAPAEASLRGGACYLWMKTERLTAGFAGDVAMTATWTSAGAA